MSETPRKARRPRLSRTISPARWREYRRFLEDASSAGYDAIGLEDWVDQGFPRDRRILILRHDVDQHPGSALRMLEIERDFGARATWYFRWRTAQPAVVAEVRESAAGVGLHYETLTRRHLANQLSGDSSDRHVRKSREVLRSELQAFAELFGPVRSACPHGDSRVPHLRNGDLLRDEDCEAFGIEFDGNEIMRGKRVGYWLTDRSRPDGGWSGGISPANLLREGTSPMLCVIHPNNWSSGMSLWTDRGLSAVLPAAWLGRGSWPVRTASDEPPISDD